MRTRIPLGTDYRSCVLHCARESDIFPVFRRYHRLCLKVTDNLVEEILRQFSMQAVTGLLMAAFTQVYSENREKKKSIKT